jgi:hypothetical protein
MSRTTNKIEGEVEDIHFLWRTSCREFDNEKDVQKLQEAVLDHNFYQWTSEQPRCVYAWVSQWNKYRGEFERPALVYIDDEGLYYPDKDGIGYEFPSGADLMYSIQPIPGAPKP